MLTRGGDGSNVGLSAFVSSCRFVGVVDSASDGLGRGVVDDSCRLLVWLTGRCCRLVRARRGCFVEGIGSKIRTSGSDGVGDGAGEGVEDGSCRCSCPLMGVRCLSC